MVPAAAHPCPVRDQIWKYKKQSVGKGRGLASSVWSEWRDKATGRTKGQGRRLQPGAPWEETSKCKQEKMEKNEILES